MVIKFDNIRCMEITFATEQGLRDYQEDRYVIHETPHGILLAVFDGHCGYMAADVCAKKLPALWDAAIIPDDLTATFMSLFASLDLLTEYMLDGTAASIVFVPEKSNIAHVSILGDAPVLGKTSDGKWSVSPEHNVRTNHAERAEAERRGGSYYNGYICKGESGLQMSRALGDAPLRSILNRQPEIYSIALDGVILLATDGVFDPSHSNTEKEIAAVTRLIGEGANAQNIVNRAIKNRTGDNATAILVRL